MEPSPIRTLAAVVVGIAFDIAVNGQHPGLSVPVLIAVAAVAVRATSPRTRETDVLLAAAVTFSVVVALRAEDIIVGPAMLAVGGLLALAATGPGAARLTLRPALGRGIGLARAMVRSPVFLAAPAGRLMAPGPRERLVSVLRIALIAVPVVGVFVALLASADRVFADAVIPDLDLGIGPLASHLMVAAIGTIIAGAWWPSRDLAAASTPPAPEAGREARLRPAEWTAVLAGLAAVFAVFVVIQFAFLFGGRGRVEVTPGLTYAAYARSGFFQLLAAGGLTALVLLGIWDFGRRSDPAEHRRFVALGAALTGLCLIVLASAAVRLSLYQQQFGFTISRLTAWFAIGATGAALCALLAAIATRKRQRVLPGAIAIVLAALLAAAALGPSRFVADRNLERFAATGKLDLPYLASLGPEAAPAMAGALDTLDELQRTVLRETICGSWSDPPRGWRSWNLARSRAAEVAASLDCPRGSTVSG